MVRLSGGKAGPARTLPLGVIRLADRAEGDLERARLLTEADLASVAWLPSTPGRDLYLVGGAWRALARIHMVQSAYPLSIVHHYTIGRDAARDLAATVATAPRRMLEKMPGAPRRRVDDLPLRGNGATPVAAGHGRRPRGVQRQRHSRGLVHGGHTARDRHRGPGLGGEPRPRPAGDPRSKPPCRPAGLDGGSVSRGIARRGDAARSRLPAVGSGQSRTPGISRRAGLQPRIAAAWHRARPSPAGRSWPPR